MTTSPRSTTPTINSATWRYLMTLISNKCKTMQHIKTAHANFITHGLSRNTYAISKILSAYSTLSLPYASYLFSHFPTPNSFFYNTLIRAYSKTQHPSLSLHYFNLMVRNKDMVVCPDEHTFPFVLHACAAGRWVRDGGKVHAMVVRNGYVKNEYVKNGVLRLYCECGEVGDGRKVFDEMRRESEVDVVKWNVMMNGYVKCGFASEGLRLFKEMVDGEVEVDVDEFCVATAVNACAKMGVLREGEWVHEYAKRRGKMGMDMDIVVRTALVDMYAKCGCIEKSVEVFEKISGRNEKCWAALISGLAFNGLAREAIGCLERMEVEDGIRPDGVSILGALVACTHGGFVEEGLFLLDRMERKYGVVAKHEHYSCVVDIFCKAGRLYEALGVIKRMPMKPLASVWGALLSGCRMHKNVELAELAVKELEQLEEGKDGIYVELSNIYLASRKVEDASRVRRLIGDRGMKKTAGYSAVEVNGLMTDFVSGDFAHPHSTLIYDTLHLMAFELFQHSTETLMLEGGWRDLYRCAEIEFQFGG